MIFSLFSNHVTRCLYLHPKQSPLSARSRLSPPNSVEDTHCLEPPPRARAAPQ